MPKGLDLSNRIFGQWRVLSRATNDRWGERQWNCICVCGSTGICRSGNLTSGGTLRCSKCAIRFRGNNRIKENSSARCIFGHYKYSAKRRNLIFELSFDDFFNLIQQPCHYCGATPSRFIKSRKGYNLTLVNGIDRKDNKMGYTLHNSLPCCEVCNYQKSNAEYSDFVSWIARVYTNLNRSNE